MEPKEALSRLRTGERSPEALATLARHLFTLERSRDYGTDPEDACYAVVEFMAGVDYPYIGSMARLEHEFLLHVEDEATLEQDRIEAAEDDARFAYDDSVVRPGWARRFV